MKPRLKIVCGRPMTIRIESPKLTAARKRFSENTGERDRLFIHEKGSRWISYPERVLTRWGRKADFLNVKGDSAT